ncbi:MAG: BON domain-containing protein [Acidobacteria bacterium]|nr:BON domain-containing protein [Acidobacteriota bacterium]
MRKLLVSSCIVLAGILVAGAARAADEAATDPDWMTTAKVKLTLLEKLGAEALEINVDTDEGAVTLTGDVEKRESKELAPKLAKSVDGVRSVDDRLRLEATGTYGNSRAAEAEAEVKDAILESRMRIALIDALGTEGFRVGTEAVNGVVLLEFDRDTTKATRERAVSAVRSLDGVQKVTTTIED